MKVVYFLSSGRSDPTRATVPLHLAVNGSVDAGHEVEIILGGDATDLILGDAPETVEGVGVPPLRDLLAKARDNKVPFYI